MNWFFRNSRPEYPLKFDPKLTYFYLEIIRIEIVTLPIRQWPFVLPRLAYRTLGWDYLNADAYKAYTLQFRRIRNIMQPIHFSLVEFSQEFSESGETGRN